MCLQFPVPPASLLFFCWVFVGEMGMRIPVCRLLDFFGKFKVRDDVKYKWYIE